MNYFEFYGIEPSFYIDESALKMSYYSKMRELHPDMHMQSADEEKERILELSSYNNEAYNILKDFHSRMRYISEMYSEGEEKKQMPQMFLMEMMDVNEEVMELQFDYNAEKAKGIKDNVESQESKMLEELEVLLKGVKLEEGLAQDVADGISEYLLKRNYLKRIIENVGKVGA